MTKRRYNRSKLSKLLNSKEELVYETTVEDCVEWFRILNRELFNSRLPNIDYVDIRWRRKSWAYYQYFVNKDTKEKESCLNMNKRYKSKKFFVEVLAHELVHHYQFMYDESDMQEEGGHGESFMRWKSVFEKKGLNLVKSYEDEK